MGPSSKFDLLIILYIITLFASSVFEKIYRVDLQTLMLTYSGAHRAN